MESVEKEEPLTPAENPPSSAEEKPRKNSSETVTSAAPNICTYNKQFKVMLVGDSGVGKTALLRRVCENQFIEEFESTIGVDYMSSTWEVDNLLIKLQLWDTAGQERFRTITSNYYKRAHAIFLVYDVANIQSFNNLSTWLNDILLFRGAIPKILIGNKSDLERRREVDMEKGASFAKDHSMLFFETSAKTSKEVEEAFQSMARLVWANQEQFEKENVNGVSVSRSDAANKKNCCAK